jgi:hypothetical protein
MAHKVGQLIPEQETEALKGSRITSASPTTRELAL